MQKQISTLTGIIIIVAATVILFGGVFGYKYFSVKQLQLAEKALQAQQILDKSFPLAGESTTETAGWKTYTNTQYGFNFQYPQVYGLLKQDANYPYTGGLANVKASFLARASSEQDKYRLKIAVVPINTYRFSNTGGETISYDSINGRCKRDLNNFYEKNNNFNFQGYKGCYISEGDIIGGFVGYLIPNIKNQQLVEILINFSDNGLSSEEALKDLNSIISTFKFTK
ncbi:MAG: hypothetical protein AAB352_00455 [Patescibacteria group bacterium]